MDEQLPLYSILIPLYKESKTLKRLIEAIENFDYPKARLEVLWLIEEEDIQTANSIKALKPSYLFELVTVPYASLKTKPRALNYGLLYAKGTYITVYDAEDVPEPLQLRKAVEAFRTGPPSLICVQARLWCANYKDNWLTMLSALEYIQWFNYILPALVQSNAPLLLGGSSNHFLTIKLRDLKGWDPYNVTEDADLGLRLAAEGYKAQMINSFTYEELPNHYIGWINQRSRWIKGHMMTYFVHLRSTRSIIHHCGIKGFLYLQGMMLIPTLIHLFLPITFMVVLTDFFYISPHHFSLKTYPFLVLLFNFFISLLQHFMVIYKSSFSPRRKIIFIGASFLIIPYWMLSIIAGIKGLYSWIFTPYHWAKTEHGLAKNFVILTENTELNKKK